MNAIAAATEAPASLGEPNYAALEEHRVAQDHVTVAV